MKKTLHRIGIRVKVYRGVDGFLLYGHDPQGRKVSIFARKRVTAEHIRNQVRAGHRLTLSDWALDDEGSQP